MGRLQLQQKMLLVSLWSLASLISLAYGDVAVVKCQNIEPGQWREECHVECKSDGTCDEWGHKHDCLCNGQPKGYPYFKTFDAEGKVLDSVGQANAQCKKMEKRCADDCKKGAMNSGTSTSTMVWV